MKNGLAEDILGEEGRSRKLRTRGRENENFACRKKEGKRGDEEEEEKENKETAPMKEGKAREWGATHIYFISLQTKRF
jgi:hypothetical protein